MAHACTRSVSSVHCSLKGDRELAGLWLLALVAAILAQQPARGAGVHADAHLHACIQSERSGCLCAMPSMHLKRCCVVLWHACIALACRVRAPPPGIAATNCAARSQQHAHLERLDGGGDVLVTQRAAAGVALLGRHHLGRLGHLCVQRRLCKAAAWAQQSWAAVAAVAGTQSALARASAHKRACAAAQCAAGQTLTKTIVIGSFGSGASR